MSVFIEIYYYYNGFEPNLLIKVLLYTFEYIIYAVIVYALIALLVFFINSIFAKKKLLNKCKNKSFAISKINPYELGVKVVENKSGYVNWEFSEMVLDSIMKGNKFIIISGKTRTGKTRTICEILRSFSDKKMISNYRDINNFTTNIKKYLFIYPKREEIEHFNELKIIPKSFFFRKLNYVVFLDDILDLKVQDYKTSGFLNFFLENSNDLLLIMVNRIEIPLEYDNKNIGLYKFIEDYKKEICLKNKKDSIKYINPHIINVPRINYEVLKNFNNKYIEKKSEDYLKVSVDGTLQPIFYAESLGYRHFLKLDTNQKKILFSAKLLSYSTAPFFSKKILKEMYESDIFNGDEFEFNPGLNIILDTGLFYRHKEKDNYYGVDPGIMMSTLRDYPEENLYKEDHINKLIEICTSNQENRRLFYIGNRLSFDKRHREAEKAYRSAIEINPKKKEYWCNLGVMLANQNKNDEAGKAYKKALEIDSNSKEILANLAGFYGEQGNWVEAEKFCKKALKIDKNYFNALVNLGACLCRIEKYNEAEKICRRALTINKNNSVAWINFGTSLVSQGKLSDSEKAYKKALEIDSNDASGWLYLGNNLADQKKYEEAEKAYQKAIGLDKNNASYWYRYAGLLVDQKRFKEAEETYKKSLELDKELMGAWNDFGSCLAEQKKYKEAEINLNKALEFERQDKGIWFNLGTVLNGQKKYVKAIEAFKKTLKIDENYREAYVNISDCFLSLKKYAEAEEACKKALNIDSDCKITLFNYGISLREQGNINEAEKVFRKALEIDENFTEVKQELEKCVKVKK